MRTNENRLLRVVRGLCASALCVLALQTLFAADSPTAKNASAKSTSSDPVVVELRKHANAHPHGRSAFSWDQQNYQSLDARQKSDLPIGVFDSGIGGLTVLEALLTIDLVHNDTLQPGADGQPDFAGERFVYLGDQANMPYGNYSARGREDYLRELILKDAVFLLGRRFHQRYSADAAWQVRLDKPPVKAIVIACNTATAYGLESLRELLDGWQLDIPVVGVVEAGARGVLAAPGQGGVGVLATVGTCASEVYPRTIARTLGRAGSPLPMVAQWGSSQLAGVIEGDPTCTTPLAEQVANDIRALVVAHRRQVQEASAPPIPLQKIVLGCTHYPLVRAELDAALAALRADPVWMPWIAEQREFVNPAEWTARELLRELARSKRRRSRDERAKVVAATAPQSAQFFLSVARDDAPGVQLAAPGVLDTDYKYGRDPGRFDHEDTLVVPLTQTLLPEGSRKLLRDRLPAVWKELLPATQPAEAVPQSTTEKTPVDNAPAEKPPVDKAALAKSLMFHASFDGGPDADFARGDRRLWNAPALNQRDAATPGLPKGGEVVLEPGKGRFGGAIRFQKSAGPMVFYRAEGNLSKPTPNWSGTVSFWLSTDPATDLPDGFCDPLQITSKKWDDAAFFVEFEKRGANIPFRLGVYADTPVWNPLGRKWEEIPVAEKPLVAIAKPPFRADQWTHVVVTFAKFNTGESNGTAKLYVADQRLEITPRTQTFTWDSARAAVMLGLGYIGRMDDLALFDRELSADEVACLQALPKGVAELHSK